LRYEVQATSGPGFRDEFAHGTGVLLSANLAYRAGLRPGDAISLRTPRGPREFRVSAVVTDFTLDVGTLIIEQGTYREAWNDAQSSIFYLWLVPGARVEDVRAAIRARLGSRLRFAVMTSREFKRGVVDALDRAMSLTDAVEVVAVVIAVIGMANFFVLAVGDRRRQIGLLRCVALNRRQLERALLLEALFLGGVGGAMAVAYALPVSFFLVTRSARFVSGWTLELRFPLFLAAATVGVAALIAPLAAVLPVRVALAEPIADQIGAE